MIDSRIELDMPANPAPDRFSALENGSWFRFPDSSSYLMKGWKEGERDLAVYVSSGKILAVSPDAVVVPVWARMKIIKEGVE